MTVDLTHCYIGTFGLTLTLVFGVYVVARVLWILSKFRNSDRVQAHLDWFAVCRRTDLPESDLRRIPKWLQNSGIEASAHFELCGRDYRTRMVTYWDFVGMTNYSHGVSNRLRTHYESGEPVDILVNRGDPRIGVIAPTFSGMAITEMAAVFVAVTVLAWFAVDCLESLSSSEIVATSLIGGLVALIGVVACLVRANKRIYGEED